MKRDKAKVRRCTVIFRKFKLYHSWRRYAQNVNFANKLRDKAKIDGAYLLIKRLKNRLKGLDEVVHKVSNDKINHTDFELFKKSMSKHRADSVFDDMK